MDNTNLLHRLHTDLDYLTRRGVWQASEQGRNFKERTRDRLLKGYEEKHEKALQTLTESHGLPLTAEEYTRWRDLLRPNSDGELYYDVCAYAYLKPLHEQRNVAVFEDAIERLHDSSLQRRRPLLIDGYLAYLETQLYEEGRNSRWSEHLENMRTWVRRAQMPDLTVIWSERIRILETYCAEDLEGLNEAVDSVSRIGQPNSHASWMKFRYRQAKVLAKDVKEKLLAAILEKLIELDLKFSNPNYTPTPDELALALEYALMAANMVTDQHPAAQAIQRVLGRCTRSAQLAAIKRYFDDKRERYLRALATEPVEDVLGEFEKLNNQVGRIHRALSRFSRRVDQTADFNPMLFQEIAEGLPNQQPNRSVRHITELLRVVAKGVAELREQYIKLLRGDDEMTLGKQTWEFPMLSAEAVNADAKLDTIAGQNVIYEIYLFSRLETNLKEHFTRIEAATRRVSELLKPEKRKVGNPLRLYREARQQLDAIEAEADAVRGLRGYERLLDVGIFKVPDAFVRSSPRVTLDRRYNQLQGLDEHKDVVGRLIERADRWDKWRQKLLKAYDESFADKLRIDDWSIYVDMLYSKLPVASLGELDDGLYGSTLKWLNAIKDISHRPSVNKTTLEKILERDAVGKLCAPLLNTFKATPPPALPEDLSYYYGSYDNNNSRSGGERMLGDLVEHDLSKLDPNGVLEKVENRLKERAEALAQKYDKLRRYVSGVERIIGYVEEAKRDTETELARLGLNRAQRAQLQNDLNNYNMYLSVLKGEPLQGNTQ